MNQKEIERWYRLRNLKRAAQILVLASVALLVAGYAVSRFLVETPQAVENTPDSSGKVRVENFSYSHRGVYPVEVWARVAVLSTSLENAELSSPSVTFRSKDGRKLILTAEKGEYDKKKGLVKASGNVKIQYEDLILTADEISYSMDEGMVWTESAVLLKGPSFQLEGGGLTLWLDTEKFALERDVRATFFGQKWMVSEGSPVRTEKEHVQ